MDLNPRIYYKFALNLVYLYIISVDILCFIVDFTQI